MIDRKLASFLEDGRSISIGTRNERLEPNGARGAAVMVDEDGRHLAIYVPKVAAPAVLRDLESNGQVAIVFCRVTDDRTYQVKGTFVEARPAKLRERRIVLEQWERFLDALATIGLGTLGRDSWVAWPAVVIRVRVTALFEQTPGPRAGTAIE